MEDIYELGLGKNFLDKIQKAFFKKSTVSSVSQKFKIFTVQRIFYSCKMNKSS